MGIFVRNKSCFNWGKLRFSSIKFESLNSDNPRLSLSPISFCRRKHLQCPMKHDGNVRDRLLSIYQNLDAGSSPAVSVCLDAQVSILGPRLLHVQPMIKSATKNGSMVVFPPFFLERKRYGIADNHCWQLVLGNRWRHSWYPKHSQLGMGLSTNPMDGFLPIWLSPLWHQWSLSPSSWCITI